MLSDQAMDYNLLSVLVTLAQIGVDAATARVARAQVALDVQTVAIADAQVVVDIFAAIAAIGSYKPPTPTETASAN